MSVEIPIKATPDNAMHPNVPRQGDAGLDLYVSETTVALPNRITPIHHDIAVQIPDGYVGLLCFRSSSAGRGLIIPNGHGVIDSSYRGPLFGLVYNFTDAPVHVYRGDRVFQLVIVPCLQITPVRVDELAPTLRGADGLGSTGK